MLPCAAIIFTDLSVPSSAVVFTVRFADKDGVASDNLDILPANSYPLSLSADSEVFRSAVDNERGYPSAAGIHLDIAHKSETASV